MTRGPGVRQGRPDAQPIDGGERLTALDTLRGVAVLGILVMNVYAFAMPFAAYGNPLLAGGTEPHNLAVWFVTHIVFDQKFMAIFSMLLGAGILLMSTRTEQRGAEPAALFYRRQVGLLVIGLLHAYLLWFGDILFYYAVTGMVVYTFRRMGATSLVVAGCLLLVVAPLVSYGAGNYLASLESRSADYSQQKAAGATLDAEQLETIAAWERIRATVLPGAAEVAADVETYRGSYRDILGHRAPLVASFHLEALPLFAFWRIGGLMLLGMALLKLGVLSGHAGTAYYRRLVIAGYALGLPLCIASAFVARAHGFDSLYMLRIGQLPNYAGSVLVALGHIGVVMLLLERGVLRGLSARCAAVGRMALSNYLFQSVVMTWIFYGYGLGLYAHVSRSGQLAIVAGVILLQLWLSPWWLARFRFGPVEWAWRSVTYLHRQPLRRSRRGPEAG